MTRMYFSASGCQGVTSGTTGKSYDADRQGFIHVDDPVDVKVLKAGGYLQAGGMPRISRYWRCDKCNWDATINHCARCDSHKLRRVEQ